MKKLLHISLLFSLVIGVTCCKTKQNNPAPSTNNGVSFDTTNYSQFLICNAGGYAYNTGNSLNNTTSVYAFKVSNVLYLTTDDGNFIARNVSPMEFNLQLQNFDPVNLKSYDVSGTYPSEIMKYKHTSEDNYDTNNGVNTLAQKGTITITNIKNGYYTGNFSFTMYKVSDRTKTLAIINGHFKFKL